MHPLAVAFEEDLQGGRRSAAQLDGVALDDVGVLRLLDEVRQGALHRRQGVRLNVARATCERNTKSLVSSLLCDSEMNNSRCDRHSSDTVQDGN